MLSHFGEALTARRRAAGRSRRELAGHAGISTAQLSALETCAASPTGPVIDRIADALGTTSDGLRLAAGIVPDWLRKRARTEPEAVLAAFADDLPPRTVTAATTPRPVMETPLGKLYNADCMDVLRTLPGQSVDMVFADPPFNLDKDYGPGVDDALPESAYMDWSVAWLGESVRVLKDGGSLFLFNLPRWNLRLGAWLTQHLEFRHWIAVDLKFSLPIQGRLYPSHYSLLYFTKGRKPTAFDPPRLPITTCRHCGGELRDYGGYKNRMNPHGVNVTDVWTDLSPVRHARFKRRRTANELPLKMLDRVLDIASRPGDLVLDPFGGSGTTYVAAELKGRRWLGTEMGDCDPIRERFGALDREREHLDRIRSGVNTLFTADALRLRDRHGHDTSRYRLPDAGPSSTRLPFGS